MAKKVTVTLIDDYDGKSKADETVQFSIDGVAYEIDLSTLNAGKLRGALEPWTEKGPQGRPLEVRRRHPHEVRGRPRADGGDPGMGQETRL